MKAVFWNGSIRGDLINQTTCYGIQIKQEAKIFILFGLNV